MLRHRAAEIVVGGHSVDLDSFILRDAPQAAAAFGRHVERVAVRTLAVDLDALVAKPARSLDHLLNGERSAAIPDAAVRDAVKAKLDFAHARQCIRSIQSSL